jgi:hypothetical protein
VELDINIYGRKRQEKLLATGLGKQKVILGFTWLQEANPIIDWTKGTLEWREASSYMMEYLERLERESYKRQNPDVPIVDEEPMPIDPITGKEDILFASIQEEEEEDIVDCDHLIFSTQDESKEETSGWDQPNLSTEEKFDKNTTGWQYFTLPHLLRADS